MKIFYDFHIHTALSPCADDDMTPNNVVNMAKIKGLSAIAITDHNSILNCEACMNIGEAIDLIVIPGMELQTKEDVHVLCLFENLEDAKAFYEIVKSRQLPIPNRPDKFGKQLVLNEEDEVLMQAEISLFTSIDMGINEALKTVSGLNGVLIPAHIDRPANGIIANLGFIPPDLNVGWVEVSSRPGSETYYDDHKDKYNILRDSDAHYLVDISEPENAMEVEALTIESIFKELRKGK